MSESITILPRWVHRFGDAFLNCADVAYYGTHAVARVCKSADNLVEGSDEVLSLMLAQQKSRLKLEYDRPMHNADVEEATIEHTT